MNKFFIPMLSPSSQKIQDLLNELEIASTVIEIPTSTKTSQEAANAVKCDIGQIAKSIMFKTKTTNRPVLVITSGPNRVNEKLVSQDLNEKIKFADPEFVRSNTGFVIGGVPPIGHTIKPVVYLDEDLTRYEEVWTAAGTPNSLFKIKSDELLKITEPKVLKIV